MYLYNKCNFSQKAKLYDIQYDQTYVKPMKQNQIIHRKKMGGKQSKTLIVVVSGIKL